MLVKISRKRWCRGGGGSPALRTESGQSCCLGFVARAHGLRTKTGTATFGDLAIDGQNIDLLPKKLRPTKSPYSMASYDDTDLHNQLTEVNDDSQIEPAERERKITKLLKRADVDVIFVD